MIIRLLVCGRIAFQEESMSNWVLEKSGFDPKDAASDGNRFLCANGYMGLRGVAEEAGPSLFPAVTLAGVYDQYQDRWREPVNAPGALFVRLLSMAGPWRWGKRNRSAIAKLWITATGFFSGKRISAR